MLLHQQCSAVQNHGNFNRTNTKLCLNHSSLWRIQSTLTCLVIVQVESCVFSFGRFCMVYSEVPNFSEPNPEYLALMNKPVRSSFPPEVQHYVLCYNTVINCCSYEVSLLRHRDLTSKETTQTTTTVPRALQVSSPSSGFNPRPL